MLKMLLATLLLYFPSSMVSADDARPTKYVNLNIAGEMKKMRESNPSHYERVQAILEGLAERRSSDVPNWMRTRFEARNVVYTDILLTTEPAQRDLSFVLDDTAYRARVTLEGGRAQVWPIKNP